MNRTGELVKNDDGSIGPYACQLCGGCDASYAIVAFDEHGEKPHHGKAICEPCARTVASVFHTTDEDRPIPEDDDIRAAHPSQSEAEDRYETYGVALRMVGAKHSKYALVDLVNWLLVERDEASTLANSLACECGSGNVPHRWGCHESCEHHDHHCDGCHEGGICTTFACLKAFKDERDALRAEVARKEGLLDSYNAVRNEYATRNEALELELRRLELELRRHLWLGHGHGGPTLYGDDGEMQCRACRIDYRRASLVEVRACVERAKIEQVVRKRDVR